MSDFKVSVIIPVYNAEKFLTTAVESAIVLPEVAEVILVDDGYPDNALQIAYAFEKSSSKVKVFRHPGGENRGAGESRNLGVRNATCDFIAFLDADDFYLPNRFDAARKIFAGNENVDGVYDAVGTKFYDDAPVKIELRDGLTTIPSRPSGEKLFETLINPGHGHFCTDGIVVKKSVIEKAGYFNPQLRLHQDTDLWIKLSYVGQLLPGITDKAVAMRGVHVNNRIASRGFESKAKLYKSLFDFFLAKKMSRKAAFILFRNYVLYNKIRFQSRLMNGPSNLFFALKTLARHPGYILKLIIGK
jgi:glycosyltransferase involved in cell wall biosynthesis